MLFKFHYALIGAGYAALSLLLGVYIREYTDASAFEIGLLLMLMPISGIFFRPIICSVADRAQSYQKYMMILLAIVTLSYSPFIIIPFLGPEVYVKHARICWYILLVVKVLGDIAFGGLGSIGDALAINYAERVGTDFMVYRLWGTLSWMMFGLIIGQVNEVSFLPKYVPAFMILCLSFLLDFIVVWLWPIEYFQMVPVNRDKKKGEDERNRPLMPREVVLAQMKRKLLNLITFSKNQKSKLAQPVGKVHCNVQHSTTSSVVIIANNLNEGINTTGSIANESIDRKTQSKILMTLLRKDLRIVPYLMLFVCIGASFAPINYFFISLSNICDQEKTCDFSQLAGLLQFCMSSAETVVFIYIKRVSDKFGRLNVCAFAMLLFCLKYSFYATVWRSVNPYYCLLVELIHGVCFGIYMVTSVDMGHLFSNEVEFILPGLIEKRIIESNPERNEKLKMSLAATMQSLIHSAHDGIGQGVGSLLYGLLLEHYTYETLWLIIAYGTGIVCLIMVVINTLDKIFHFDLGLVVCVKKKELVNEENDEKINPKVEIVKCPTISSTLD